MPPLVTTSNLPEADELYAELIALHRDLDPAACRRLDARLILLLMNHIGDPEALRDALTLAAIADEEMRG